MTYYETASELGVYEMWQVHRERTELAAMYLRRWNECKGLDAILGLNSSPYRIFWTSLTIIGPTTPYATVKHGDFQHVGYVLQYILPS